MDLPIEDIKIDDIHCIKIDVYDETGMFQIYKKGDYSRSQDTLELALLDIVFDNSKYENISDSEFQDILKKYKKETFQKLQKMGFEIEEKNPDTASGLSVIIEGSDNFKLPFFRGYPQNYFKPGFDDENGLDVFDERDFYDNEPSLMEAIRESNKNKEEDTRIITWELIYDHVVKSLRKELSKVDIKDKNFRKIRSDLFNQQKQSENLFYDLISSLDSLSHPQDFEINPPVSKNYVNENIDRINSAIISTILSCNKVPYYNYTLKPRIKHEFKWGVEPMPQFYKDLAETILKYDIRKNKKTILYYTTLGAHISSLEKKENIDPKEKEKALKHLNDFAYNIFHSMGSFILNEDPLYAEKIRQKQNRLYIHYSNSSARNITFYLPNNLKGKGPRINAKVKESEKEDIDYFIRDECTNIVLDVKFRDPY